MKENLRRASQESFTIIKPREKTKVLEASKEKYCWIEQGNLKQTPQHKDLILISLLVQTSH